MPASRPSPVRRVVRASFRALDPPETGAPAWRPRPAVLLPYPGVRPTPFAVPAYRTVWTCLDLTPSLAVQEISAEAAERGRAAEAVGRRWELRHCHDRVLIPLLWHLGFFELERLTAPAETARAEVIDLLLALDRRACEPAAGRRAG